MGWGLEQPNMDKKENRITAMTFDVLTLIHFLFAYRT
jgi:hypothetical protein